MVTILNEAGRFSWAYNGRQKCEVVFAGHPTGVVRLGPDHCDYAWARCTDLADGRYLCSPEVRSIALPCAAVLESLKGVSRVTNARFFHRNTDGPQANALYIHRNARGFPLHSSLESLNVVKPSFRYRESAGPLSGSTATVSRRKPRSMPMRSAAPRVPALRLVIRHPGEHPVVDLSPLFIKEYRDVERLPQNVRCLFCPR